MALPKRDKKGRFVKKGRKKGQKRKHDKKRKKGGRGRYGHAARKSPKKSKRRGRRFSDVCKSQFRAALKSGDKSYAMRELQMCDKAEKTIAKEKRLKALEAAREARKVQAAKRAEAKEKAKAKREYDAAIKRGERPSRLFGIEID